MSKNFEQFNDSGSNRTLDAVSHHMMGDVVQSGFHCQSSDSTAKNNSANDHLPSLTIGSSKNITDNASAIINTASSASDNAASNANTSALSSDTTQPVNPANDTALQNLMTTGDSQLKSDLQTAYADVQNGSLTANAYNTFENSTIPLTNPTSDIAKGLSFDTDKQLEEFALGSTSQGMSSSDMSTLQSIIRGQTGDATGGGGYTGGDAWKNIINGKGTPTPPATESAYNPANDALLQNLSNTGDSQLQSTLFNAYNEVQNGQLSQGAYDQFENASIGLTNPVTDLSKGLSFSSDIPLEQYALTGISKNLSASDNTALQSLIGQSSGTTPPENGSGGTDGSGGATNGNDAKQSLSQLISADTRADNSVLPALIPTNDSAWGGGAEGPFPAGVSPNTVSPSTTEANAWFIGFPAQGSSINVNDKIQVKNMDEYILSDSGQWREVTGNQANQGLWSGEYPYNFQGASSYDTQVNNADGSVTISGIDGTTSNDIYHGGIAGGDYNPATDQGVYVTLDAKVDKSADSNSNYVMQVGNDFGGAMPDGTIKNTGSSGNSNWYTLTDQYQNFGYSSVSPDVLESNPPPGIAS